MTERDWYALLRSLDNMEPRSANPAWPRWWETPPDFDVAACNARLTHLTALLTELFGGPVDQLPGWQDSSLFGMVGIPATLTRTRPKPRELTNSLTIHVSNFSIATLRPRGHARAEDMARVELACEEAGYPLVPGHVIDSPYDGHYRVGTEDWTWFTRFFDYL